MEGFHLDVNCGGCRCRLCSCTDGKVASLQAPRFESFSECLKDEVYVNKKERYQFRKFPELSEGASLPVVA
jgi:hypothetical protein